MTKLAHRHTPMADLLERFDWRTPSWFRAPETMAHITVEDYVEQGTYVLRAELPGIDPDEDVSLTVEGDHLTISGERREETKEKGHREFHYGAFTRTVTLPAGAKAEDITATYTDGVLEVRVPMPAEQPRPAMRIQVTR